VDGSTPVVNSTSASNGTYGYYMRFEGTIQLANGQVILIAHDCGVSLWIDGVRVPGFTDGCDSSLIQNYQFPGLTGAHKIELLYVNRDGPGSLSFSAKM
jgi:hypothetical protein